MTSGNGNGVVAAVATARRDAGPLTTCTAGISHAVSMHVLDVRTEQVGQRSAKRIVSRVRCEVRFVLAYAGWLAGASAACFPCRLQRVGCMYVGAALTLAGSKARVWWRVLYVQECDLISDVECISKCLALWDCEMNQLAERSSTNGISFHIVGCYFFQSSLFCLFGI